VNKALGAKLAYQVMLKTKLAVNIPQSG